MWLTEAQCWESPALRFTGLTSPPLKNAGTSVPFTTGVWGWGGGAITELLGPSTCGGFAVFLSGFEDTTNMRLMGLCNKQRNCSKKKGKEEALPWCRAASWEIFRRLISEQIELPCQEPFLISSQLLVAHTQKIRQKKQRIDQIGYWTVLAAVRRLISTFHWLGLDCWPVG